MIKRYEALGLARAFVDDTPGAEAAFQRLLLLAPAHSLSYTMSPKATFPFERARRSVASQPALEARLDPPPPSWWGDPLRLTLARVADPQDLIASFRLCSGIKGGGRPTCQLVPAPPVGERSPVELPPVARPPELVEGTGVFLQLTLVGLDAESSEVWRGPPPERPLELGVGFAPPEPWYTSPWTWGIAAAGTATVVTAVVLGTLFALRPTTADTSYVFEEP
jgi:hypothetical protein